MSKSFEVDLSKIRAEVARRQRDSLSRGVPIYYMEGGDLIEELPDGTRRKSSGAPRLDCADDSRPKRARSAKAG